MGSRGWTQGLMGERVGLQRWGVGRGDIDSPLSPVQVSLRTPLLAALPSQRLLAIVRAQDGASRGEIGFADARSAPLDPPACATRIVERLQGKRSAALNRSKSETSRKWWAILGLNQ